MIRYGKWIYTYKIEDSDPFWMRILLLEIVALKLNVILNKWCSNDWTREEEEKKAALIRAFRYWFTLFSLSAQYTSFRSVQYVAHFICFYFAIFFSVFFFVLLFLRYCYIRRCLILHTAQTLVSHAYSFKESNKRSEKKEEQ